MDPVEDSCASCRFYQVFRRVGNAGQCRRFPPAIFAGLHKGATEVRFRFPEVFYRDWCGEHQRTPKTEGDAA